MLDVDIVTLSDDYYVYEIIERGAEIPFYVGKGRHGRIFAHEEEASRGCKGPKFDVIRDIQARGNEVERRIVYATPVERDAYIYEWFLINVFYGIENLTNIPLGRRIEEESIWLDGAKVRGMREEAMLTAFKLAFLADVSLSTINRIEREKRAVTRLKAYRIIHVLSPILGREITLDEIVLSVCSEDRDDKHKS
jgi:hypothetical protein